MLFNYPFTNKTTSKVKKWLKGKDGELAISRDTPIPQDTAPENSVNVKTVDAVFKHIESLGGKIISKDLPKNTRGI